MQVIANARLRSILQCDHGVVVTQRSAPQHDQREAFIEAVLSVVEQIPPGQVASYGDIAAYIGRGGPRQVGHVMAGYGAAVCWWRVVRADGQPVRGLENAALAHLAEDGAPLARDRVIMRLARWAPVR